MEKKKSVWLKMLCSSLLIIFSLSYCPSCFAEEEALINWKTYHNKQFNYEIKYPVDYNLINKTTSLRSVLFESEEIKQFDDGRERPYYMLSISIRSVNISLKEFVEKQVDLLNKGGFVSLETKDEIVAGILTKKLLSITNASGSVIFSQAYLLKDGNMYFIRVSTIKNDTKFTDKIFNLILSSFKFTHND